MNPRRIYFFVNRTKPGAVEAHAALAGRLAASGMEEAPSAADADIVVALGGDGTILRAVRSFPGMPVAGFNIGSLGYLSAVERKDFGTALEMLAQGRFSISARTMLDVSANGAPAATALNDIVLMRESSGRAATFALFVDSTQAARYAADGLVFATPTGSTAYSLAAGGPVLMPDSRSFVITPMNPHALGMRPMVVSDSVLLEAEHVGRGDGEEARIGVYADGEAAFFLDPGARVSVSRSTETASLVQFDGHNPYETLSRKLGWTLSRRGTGAERNTP